MTFFDAERFRGSELAPSVSRCHFELILLTSVRQTVTIPSRWLCFCKTQGGFDESQIVRLLSAPDALARCRRRAYAQGSFFTSLSGTVVDTPGGVIPGADVKVKNTGTGAEVNTVTGSDGGFTVPSLPGGTYTVTVSLMGFKTAVAQFRDLECRGAREREGDAAGRRPRGERHRHRRSALGRPDAVAVDLRRT